MFPIFRLLSISRIALLRYRLDTFLHGRPLPWLLRLPLAPLKLLPLPREPRGRRLRRACEDLGPIFIKFGQLLSTRPDLLPADLVTELDRLQDDVPPFPAETFRRLVEDNLEQPIQELFAGFEDQPLASASVAQVHAAELKSGEAVVVKAIRPGMEQVVEQDIKLMAILARWLERALTDGRRLRPVEVVEEYRQTINNELNLEREAANASLLRRNFAGSPLLYVPEVHWPMVRAKVMVMERLEGIPVTDVATLEQRGTDMRRLAERGVEIFFTQVFQHNFFHADMHPGNIFVDAARPEQPSYMAVDMAIVASLNREDQFYLARNLLAMFRRDYRMVAELHVMSGWVHEDTDINEFEAAVRTVCEPLFERPLKDISFGRVLITLFQTARQFDMEVQPQLVLLQKTLLNIEGLGRQLYPELDLWSTAHPFLERWLRERVHPRSLNAQLRRYGPEWIEKFPHLPNLVYESLQQVSRLDETRRLLEEEQALRQKRSRQRWRSRAGLLALGGGLGLAWAAPLSLAQVPVPALALMGAGTLALLLR